ncbi:hypothetical protein RRG08_054114 [Elysia crispata]|uniref:Uncharacterized protein n=1 Tax=Elysia crispata TaxID=231223 RepID=A0AAE1D7G9_9GAST|nr:hypothetical protein RRG08_054114 [Elysia crispata]
MPSAILISLLMTSAVRTPFGQLYFISAFMTSGSEHHQLYFISLLHFCQEAIIHNISLPAAPVRNTISCISYSLPLSSVRTPSAAFHFAAHELCQNTISCISFRCS